MRKLRSFFSNLLIFTLVFVIGFTVLNAIINRPAKGKDISSDDLYTDGITDTTYYSQLGPTQQEIYDCLYETASVGGLSYTFKNINFDLYGEYLNDVVYALEHEHPELFWLDGGWTARGMYGIGDNNDSMTVELTTFDYWKYTVNPQKYIDALNNEINNVADMAQGLPDDYSKVKFVHDYLVTSASYDHETLEEALKTSHSASSEYIFSAYGCLVNKKTVCAGYAKSFMLILNRLGIPCNYVTGDAGERHGWNSVILDNDSYYVDVTWDDSDYTDDNGQPLYPNDAEYGLFCITTDELEKTHTIDNDFIIPEFDAEKYNYFVYQGYYIDSYSFERLQSVVERQTDKKIISIKFSSENELNKAINDIKRWNKIPIIADSENARYKADKTRYILTLLL